MHERSLMSSLMKRIGALATEARAERVVRVRVKLGALSHMSPEHFKEHFDEAAAGGIAAAAALDIVASEDRSDPDAGGILLESIDVV